jgi:hypothetical protein
MTKKVVIPPRSCIYANVKFNRVPDCDVVVNPCHNIQGLLSSNCNLAKEKQVMLFKSPTDKYINIRKSTNVGTAMQLDQIISNEEHIQSENV